MFDKLEGKKTYLLCALTIAWAIVGGLAGWLEWEAAQSMISAALIGAGLRHGVATK